MRWGGGTGAGWPAATAASSRATPLDTRAQIESSTRDRARICKYRHIYKRKGSQERRTNAALRGNQSGEIPTASDRKMSNELRVHHSARMCDTQRGRRSTAALLSPPLCWYIYRLIIGLVCVTIMKLDESQALVEGARRYLVCARALRHARTSAARAAFRFYLSR